MSATTTETETTNTLLLQIVTRMQSVTDMLRQQDAEGAEEARETVWHPRGDGQQKMEIGYVSVDCSELLRDIWGNLYFIGAGLAWGGENRNLGVITYSFAEQLVNGTKIVDFNGLPTPIRNQFDSVYMCDWVARQVCFWINPDDPDSGEPRPNSISVVDLKPNDQFKVRTILRARYIDGRYFLETCVRWDDPSLQLEDRTPVWNEMDGRLVWNEVSKSQARKLHNAVNLHDGHSPLAHSLVSTIEMILCPGEAKFILDDENAPSSKKAKGFSKPEAAVVKEARGLFGHLDESIDATWPELHSWLSQVITIADED